MKPEMIAGLVVIGIGLGILVFDLVREWMQVIRYQREIDRIYREFDETMEQWERDRQQPQGEK